MILPDNGFPETERVSQMAELLRSLFKDREKEFDRVISSTVGGALYTDYASRDSPFSDAVFELLETLEQHGNTAVLFRGVMRARPKRADLRTTLEQLCPEALTEAPATTEQVRDVIGGVDAVRKLLGAPAVYELVVASLQDLAHTSLEIETLDRYKALHECLHQLQMGPYHVIRRAVRGFRTDPRDFGELENYTAGLRPIAFSARDAAEGLSDSASGRAQELDWVVRLEGIIADLRSALDNLDELVSARAVRRFKELLRREPYRVNRLLLLTARGLHLDRLVDTLTRVASETPLENPLSGELKTGISGLQYLLPRLLALVNEHDEWQEIENDLWQADESLHQRSCDALEEFDVLWSSIRERTGLLCAAAPAEKWALDLSRYATEFETATAGAPVALIDQPQLLQAQIRFDRFRNEAMYRFYNVDRYLKTSCGEVSKISRPLNKLIAEVTDAGN